MARRSHSDNGTIRAPFRGCEKESDAGRRAYIDEGKIYAKFKGLKIICGKAEFCACKYPFADAQRSGLSGIVS
jgi:hypothetical protein